MKFECQACGGSVEYSAQLDKMVCAFCGCIFMPLLCSIFYYVFDD